MEYTRRQFGTMAMAAIPGATWIGQPSSKPNSKFGGVQVGAIS